MKVYLLIGLIALVNYNSLGNELLDDYLIKNFCYYQGMLCINKNAKVVIEFQDIHKDPNSLNSIYESYLWRDYYQMFNDSIVSLRNGVLNGGFTPKCKRDFLDKTAKLFQKTKTLTIYRCDAIKKGDRHYQVYRTYYLNCLMDIMFVYKDNKIIKLAYSLGIE